MLALGGRSGSEQSVSFTGIDEARKARAVERSRRRRFDFIQTDAATSSTGNSGGVRTVNGVAGGGGHGLRQLSAASRATARSAPRFAIPSRSLVKILLPQQLAEKGRRSTGARARENRPISGQRRAAGVSAPSAPARPGRVGAPRGVPGDPADEGGVRAGDVITSASAAPGSKKSTRDLQRVVSSTPVGREGTRGAPAPGAGDRGRGDRSGLCRDPKRASPVVRRARGAHQRGAAARRARELVERPARGRLPPDPRLATASATAVGRGGVLGTSSTASRKWRDRVRRCPGATPAVRRLV